MTAISSCVTVTVTIFRSCGLFFCSAACLVLSLVAQVETQTPAAAPRSPIQQSATYVGSATCRQCHQATYDRWTKTRMANVVTDPHVRPDVIIPDLSKPDPLVTFKLDDIAFVYGSKWKQRYFTKVGDDYFPLGAQWDITNKVWRAYLVQPNTDWWVPFYPADKCQRPTGPLVRRLPFGELRHQDQKGHRVERRLREMPWAREPARSGSVGHDDRQPGEA